MAHRDIVVIGASAGGVEALRLPPDVHLLLTRRAVRLARGDKESGNRPAIDPMFRSATLAFGPRVIGVVLTGNLDDGTSGLRAIKQAGGTSVVQDPADARFPSMPQSAIRHAPIDRVVPLQDIASTIVELISEEIATDEHAPLLDDASGKALTLADPDAISDSERHPGHGSAFVFEDAMSTALRVFEESADLARRIAARHRARGAEDLAKRFDERAATRARRAAEIRASIAGRMPATDAGESGPRRAS